MFRRIMKRAHKGATENLDTLQTSPTIQSIIDQASTKGTPDRAVMYKWAALKYLSIFLQCGKFPHLHLTIIQKRIGELTQSTYQDLKRSNDSYLRALGENDTLFYPPDEIMDTPYKSFVEACLNRVEASDYIDPCILAGVRGIIAEKSITTTFENLVVPSVSTKDSSLGLYLAYFTGEAPEGGWKFKTNTKGGSPLNNWFYSLFSEMDGDVEQKLVHFTAVSSACALPLKPSIVRGGPDDFPWVNVVASNINAANIHGSSARSLQTLWLSNFIATTNLTPICVNSINLPDMFNTDRSKINDFLCKQYNIADFNWLEVVCGNGDFGHTSRADVKKMQFKFISTEALKAAQEAFDPDKALSSLADEAEETEKVADKATPKAEKDTADTDNDDTTPEEKTEDTTDDTSSDGDDTASGDEEPDDFGGADSINPDDVDSFNDSDATGGGDDAFGGSSGGGDSNDIGNSEADTPPSHLIPKADPAEGGDAYLYRLAVLNLYNGIEKAPGVTSSAAVNLLKGWCQRWLWLASIDRTKSLLTELGLADKLKVLDLNQHVKR